MPSSLQKTPAKSRQGWPERAAGVGLGRHVDLELEQYLPLFACRRQRLRRRRGEESDDNEAEQVTAVSRFETASGYSIREDEPRESNNTSGGKSGVVTAALYMAGGTTNGNEGSR